MSMKDAMKSLKDQALAISVRAQKEAEDATNKRGAVEAQLATVTKQLDVRTGGGKG